jgi:hypothetical protein
MINYYDALYQLYPNIVRTLEDTAYDANDNEVTYDKSAVEAKLAEIQAIEIAKQEAEVAAKESALSKLTALGLTADEVKALLGIA